MTPRPKRKPTDDAVSDAGARTAKGRSRRPLESIAGDAAGTVPSLDAIIHERSRLAIVSALAAGDSRTHTELRDLLGLTDGNLSVHARKLEEAGYITCAKEFSGRTPRTTYRLGAPGRRAFDRYLAHLEQLIAAVKQR